MSKRPDALCERLDLPHTAEVTLIGEYVFPSPGVAHGLAKTESSQLTNPPTSELPELPPLDPELLDLLNSGWSPVSLGKLEINCSEAEGRVFLLEGVHGARQVVGGIDRCEGSAWLVDGRVPGSLLAFGDGLVLSVAHERLELWRVERPDEALVWPRIAHSPPELTPPDSCALLHGISGAEPLWSYLEALLSSPSLLEQAAGVGVLARSAAGVVSDPGRWLSLLKAGEASALVQAQTWARSWASATAAWFAAQMLGELDGLQAQLDGLSEALDTPRTAELMARNLCLVREHLAGVALLLEAWLGSHPDDPETDAVIAALEGLAGVDAVARGHLSELDLAGNFDDHPLLDEVALHDPAAWWGTRALA